MIKIVIPIEPKGQMRPRARRSGNRAVVYEHEKMRPWRKLATSLVKKAYEGDVLTGALRLDVTFYMRAPKKISERPTPRAKAKTWQRYKQFACEEMYVVTKPDLDNLEKAIYDSVSDALTVWHDDCQIVEHTTRKKYSPNPRIELIIEVVDEL